jgi:hypothetical protein
MWPFKKRQESEPVLVRFADGSYGWRRTRGDRFEYLDLTPRHRTEFWWPKNEGKFREWCTTPDCDIAKKRKAALDQHKRQRELMHNDVGTPIDDCPTDA